MKQENILKKDWDNLLILDGCRYDVFEAVNTLPGKLEKLWSVGRCTAEWVQETFEKKKYDNIAYFSLNPYVTEEGLKLIDMEGLAFGDWFDLVHCRHEPARAIAYILPIYSKFEKKRKIFHFMQPHTPFLRGKLKGVKNIKAKSKQGLYTGEDWLEASRLNLEIVMKAIESKLLPVLKGKTVLSADHGNACGEDGYWGHKNRSYPDKWYMREVPWFEYDSNFVVKKHLEELGYL